MTQASDQPAEFECGACARRYAWTSELAGRNVTCKCGETILCPAEPEEDIYSVADRPGETGHSGANSPARPNGGGTIGASGEPLSTILYRGPGVMETRTKAPLSDRAIDWYMPLALLGGGIAVQVVGAIIRAMQYGAGSFRHAMLDLMMALTIEPAIMLMGILIAANFRQIKFGDFVTAAMKLVAISIACSAAGTLLLPVAHLIPFLGAFFSLIVEFVLYFALIGAMFRLDESDTWYCVMVFFVLSVAMYFALGYARSFW